MIRSYWVLCLSMQFRMLLIYPKMVKMLLSRKITENWIISYKNVKKKKKLFANHVVHLLCKIQCKKELQNNKIILLNLCLVYSYLYVSMHVITFRHRQSPWWVIIMSLELSSILNYLNFIIQVGIHPSFIDGSVFQYQIGP